jgi:mannonate dehydratase
LKDKSPGGKSMSNYINPMAQLGKVKLSCYISPRATDDEIDYLELLGVPYTYTWIDHLVQNAEVINSLKKRLAERGITLYNGGDGLLAKNPSIILGLEDRDQKIAEWEELLKVMAQLGLYSMTFTWEADNVQSSGDCFVRGGAPSRYVDEREFEKRPPAHGRIYQKDELWETFTYFIKKIIPVCERLGIRLALHPCDPPLPMVNGYASLITSYDDYKKAFEIAGSKALGMEFCCGCWLEGGDRFGNLIEGFKKFARDGRVIITHFRNISAPMPYFEERFIDDGYGDMYKIMESFYEADYDGTVILDHTPPMINAKRLGKDMKDATYPSGDVFHGVSGWKEAMAFSIGYIKALMGVASRKVKGKL